MASKKKTNRKQSNKNKKTTASQEEEVVSEEEEELECIWGFVIECGGVLDFLATMKNDETDPYEMNAYCPLHRLVVDAKKDPVVEQFVQAISEYKIKVQKTSGFENLKKIKLKIPQIKNKTILRVDYDERLVIFNIKKPVKDIEYLEDINISGKSKHLHKGIKLFLKRYKMLKQWTVKEKEFYEQVPIDTIPKKKKKKHG